MYIYVYVYICIYIYILYTGISPEGLVSHVSSLFFDLFFSNTACVMYHQGKSNSTSRNYSATFLESGLYSGWDNDSTGYFTYRHGSRTPVVKNGAESSVNNNKKNKPKCKIQLPPVTMAKTRQSDDESEQFIEINIENTKRSKGITAKEEFFSVQPTKWISPMIISIAILTTLVFFICVVVFFQYTYTLSKNVQGI